MLAIVHGHTHQCAFYTWDLTSVTGQIVDVYNAPALQKGGKGDPPTTPSQFLVFELDVALRRLRAFQRIGAGWGPIMHEKTWANATRPDASWRASQSRGRARAENASLMEGGLPMMEVQVVTEEAAVGAIRVRAAEPQVVPWWVVV